MSSDAAPRVLIAYATWTGATREVSEAVARTLREAGLTVDIAEAARVNEVDSYDAVLIGNSVHAGKLTKQTVKFARRFAEKLAHKPVAWFLVCLTMMEDKPDTREKSHGFLEPLRDALPGITPLDVGLFAGAVLTETPEAKKLGFPYGPMSRAMAAKMDDYRDWALIEAWAKAMADKLLAHRVAA